MTSLSPEMIASLLKAPQVASFTHDPNNDNNMPRCSRVKWLDDKTICDPGHCGSSAYIKIDNKPRCLKHAFDDLVRILAEQERG